MSHTSANSMARGTVEDSKIFDSLMLDIGVTECERKSTSSSPSSKSGFWLTMYDTCGEAGLDILPELEAGEGLLSYMNPSTILGSITMC